MATKKKAAKRKPAKTKAVKTKAVSKKASPRSRKSVGKGSVSRKLKRAGKGSARPATGSPRSPVRLQLRYLAHARSGDKGDTANVGLIALDPAHYELLAKEVTSARVHRHFKGMVSGVTRYELPNLRALNFLLHGALDGGGTVSLKTDAQGKVYSTALLRMEIPVPAALARTLAPAG